MKLQIETEPGRRCVRGDLPTAMKITPGNWQRIAHSQAESSFRSPYDVSILIHAPLLASDCESFAAMSQIQCTLVQPRCTQHVRTQRSTRRPFTSAAPRSLTAPSARLQHSRLAYISPSALGGEEGKPGSVSHLPNGISSMQVNWFMN